MVTWSYNYAHSIETQQQLDWLNKYGIEFTPSVHGFFVDTRTVVGGTRERCYLTDASYAEVEGGSQEWCCGRATRCNAHAELSAQLGRTIQLLNVRPVYLFLANEPWYKESIGRPVIDATDYAQAYKLIAAAAAENNLRLVSPTVRQGRGPNQEATWFASFVAACEALDGCDVDKIEVFDLHYYHCAERKWVGETGVLRQTRLDLIHELTIQATTRTSAEWTEWVQGRPYIVSETSCEQEGSADAHGSNVLSCQKQSGQVFAETHGRGSLALLEETDSIERWSWWTTQRFGDEDKNMEGGLEVRLCNSESELTPMGHAWLNVTAANDPSAARIVDCDDVPPPSPPTPSPPPRVPHSRDECPHLAYLTAGRSTVAALMPGAADDYCSRLGASMCDQGYRWKEPTNKKPWIELQLCVWEVAANECSTEKLRCAEPPSLPPPSLPPPPLPVAPGRDECPHLAYLTAGRSTVAALKPGGANAFCSRLGSATICNTCYRWK
jgi:hypothetical protein